MNFFGVRRVARVQNALTGAKLTMLILFIGLALLVENVFEDAVMRDGRVNHLALIAFKKHSPLAEPMQTSTLRSDQHRKHSCCEQLSHALTRDVLNQKL